MAAPSQQQPQPYSASGYPPPIPPQGPPPGQFGGFASQLGQGQYPIQQTPMSFEKFVIIHIATTCDEHGVYVTKDSAEVIEIGWVVIDARDPDMRELHRQSVLVKPVNTPITPLCTSLTTLTWEHVRNAGSFRDAVEAFNAYAAEHLGTKNANPNDQPTFAFVTLMPWDLRVQMSREARDKNVVLPNYLQHPILFGLRSEYQGYQTAHPETLAFSSSNLGSICAGLEVEEVRSSGKVTGGLPFHLQALAPSSPRRAIEEALTLTRCVRSLVAKCRPSATNPGDPHVMKFPLDARSDVRSFLQEHSKVLHLSGLPHDTTQSELESWFTQYGGRPIAFWTLRTPEGGKPSGSGFVVFGSHEEAAESLSMNGRALNERAIEVSPSSSRVLDRASTNLPPGVPALLTPFPPSKNRPRPGDWTCPSCGFSNFQRRTACFRCSFPAMSAQQPDPYGQQYGMAPSPYGGPGGYGQQHMMGGPPMHGGYGGMGGGSSGRGGVVPFRAGDWKCGRDGCFYHNFAKNVSCLRCGAPRQEAAVVAEGGGGNHYQGHGHGAGSPYGPPGGMSMGGSMGGSQYGGMGPGGDPYGGMGPGGPPGGFGGQSFGPASTYALPSGLGAPPSYLTQGGYGQMPPQHAAGQQSPGGFDSRTEQAFNQGNASASAGAPVGYGSNGQQYGGSAAGGYGNDEVSMAFLQSGMGNLGFGERDGRNGQAGGQGGVQGGNAKSPQ